MFIWKRGHAILHAYSAPLYAHDQRIVSLCGRAVIVLRSAHAESGQRCKICLARSRREKSTSGDIDL